MNVLITGGCGFVGSNLVLHLRRARPDWRLVNLDKLTYAGNLENLRELEGDPRHVFVRGDVCDRAQVESLMREHAVELVLHLAAESHVDRSILASDPFVQTNVVGTATLLEAARAAGVKRVVHVSTDEVYGSARSGLSFDERARLEPSSPYAASKASADLLALAAHRTHGQDVVLTRSSNNYGRFQFPEKLIPLVITRALQDQPLPIYGDGRQLRDWLHVEDQCEALLVAAEKGRAGEIYNFASGGEYANLDVVHGILDRLAKPRGLIRLVEDRPGHDARYALDTRKARRELGWKPRRAFEDGLEETVRWYQTHRDWWQRILSGEYRQYFEEQYGRRLET